MLQIPRTTVLREFPRSGDDAVDAARVMSDWLENVNPGEWQCYKREPNLHLQRQKFIQEFMKVQFLVNGLEVDTAAMAPSCSLPKTNRDRSVLKAFGRMIVKGLKKSFRDAVSSSLPVGADMLADKLYGHLTNDDTTSLDPKDVSEGRMAAAAALVFMFLGEKAAQDFPHDPPDTQALKVVQAAQVLNANRRWPYPAVLVDSFGGGFWSLLVRSPFYGESHPDTKRYGKAGDLERSRIITDYYNKQFGDVLRGLGEAKDDLDISIIQRALGEELPSDATSLVHDVFGAEVAARYRAARVEAPGDALKIAASAIVIHRVMYWARGRLQ